MYIVDNTKWTQEMKDLVAQVFREGGSSRKAAETVNRKFKTGFTRNAVIGMASRNGLRQNPIMTKAFTNTASVKKKINAKIIRKVKSEFDIPKSGNPMKNPVFTEIHGAEKKLIDVGNDDCRFPIDHHDGIIYCAKKNMEGVSYCDYHAAVCFSIKEE